MISLINNLRNRKHNSESEQGLYDFILRNWIWCVPIHSRKNNGEINGLKGYMMLNKESVMKQAFDFS